ncbi:MAG TPA: anti-sigma factor [Marmoricola sp.]|jgi:anti-sigma-K factor RskA|nr:anti-sigma factor [Marmoricola sp.]
MTAHEIHALSGAYAVDALDDLERARFEQHLAVCPECRAEVASLRESAAMLTELNATPPPASLRDRVLADLRTIRPLPPEVPSPAVEPERPRPSRPAGSRAASRRSRVNWRGLGAAAAVLAVVGVGTVTVVDQLQDDSSQTVSTADRVLRAADAQSIHVDLPGDASARLVRSVSQRKAVLITNGMPEAPSGKVYELWLQNRAGEMVPAGLMPDGGDQEVVLDGDAAAATAAGITVEPAGGSDTPTSAPIALFDFAQAT